jgi:hypothetical protein
MAKLLRAFLRAIPGDTKFTFICPHGATECTRSATCSVAQSFRSIDQNFYCDCGKFIILGWMK